MSLDELRFHSGRRVFYIIAHDSRSRSSAGTIRRAYRNRYRYVMNYIRCECDWYFVGHSNASGLPIPPLASPCFRESYHISSIVRNAMVTVLTGAVAPRQCRTQDCFGNGGSQKLSGTQPEVRLGEGDEEGWSGGETLVRRDTLPDKPAICMLWCAIALGALMRGMPVDHVSLHHRTTSGIARVHFHSSNPPPLRVTI